MGDNPFEPPKRNYFLEAMLRQTQPETKPEIRPQPDWWKAWVKPPEPPSLLAAFLTQPDPPTPPKYVPQHPNPYKRPLLKPRYVYPFTNVREALKIAVWQKGLIVPEYSPAIIRRDTCGNLMAFDEHGNTDSAIGWEIDHVLPTAKGGLTIIANLQPLNWNNNRRKGDNYPWSCSARS